MPWKLTIVSGQIEPYELAPQGARPGHAGRDGLMLIEERSAAVGCGRTVAGLDPDGPNRLGAGLPADRLLFRLWSRLHKNRSIVLQRQLRPAFGFRCRRLEHYPIRLRGTELVEEQLSQFRGQGGVLPFLRQLAFEPGAGFGVGGVCPLMVAALGKMSGQLGLEGSVIRRRLG